LRPPGLLPAQRYNEKNQITGSCQDKSPADAALTEKSPGLGNDMDQPIEGKHLQNGWNYQEIIKMVERGKSKYKNRHDRKEPMGKEKPEDIEPGFPGGAGLIELCAKLQT